MNKIPCIYLQQTLECRASKQSHFSETKKLFSDLNKTAFVIYEIFVNRENDANKENESERGRKNLDSNLEYDEEIRYQGIIIP